MSPEIPLIDMSSNIANEGDPMPRQSIETVKRILREIDIRAAYGDLPYEELSSGYEILPALGWSEADFDHAIDGSWTNEA